MNPQPSQKQLTTIQINEQAISVGPNETVLAAALRSGIDFPNSCRVGGCGSCKCRLEAGKVRELTETGYLLTAEELEQGFILACQAVPQSDLRIQVDLASVAGRGVLGQIVGQEQVTHDITRLSVQLTQSLSYKAGQFANLSVEGLPGVARSYSFGSPSRRDGLLSFFVRKVPQGRFSSLVNDADLRGRSVRVDGPSGDFWLRPDEAPLLLVAGGSGLAPILAMLQEALVRRDTRSVTLLFGAREAKDLYALDEIEAIAQKWRGAFRFVPVLSEAQHDASWQGARGLVTEHIAELLEPGAHGYLCGPPAMVDGAVALLQQHGVTREHIHCDRFTTQADVTLAAADADEATGASLAGALHYLKYFGLHFIALLGAIAILGGGRVASAMLLSLVTLYMLGDALSGDDTTTPKFRFPGILTVQLWLALPLLGLIVLEALWSISPGDPFGLGAFVHTLSGYDVLAARASNTFGQEFAIFVLTGLLIGMVGTITGHELTHRTWDPVSMLVGRWLLAFSFDTSFAIEHVYGHHRYVSTTEDPATAPRGRNVYTHILVSTITGNISAWKIEAERLRKKRLPLYSHHNAVIRGQLMSATLVAIAFSMGGLKVAGFFIACALWGKSLLEIVNYMEHYGMVRHPETAVEPRHSWNTNRRISSWTMFNLTRHSHHHARGEVPYQDLKPYPNAPMMINGYLTTIVVAMLPPLWHKLMTPKVLAWDRDYATAYELELAEQANAKSGIPELMQHAPLGEPGLSAD
jgi:NAD(P)H-flavin reductase/ferredoxin/fatty-acid desaturase